MGHDTGIAKRLRDAGLIVSEVSGWQTRGSSSFSPEGSVNHHTAGGASGETPSLETCIYGRPDLAGPLCNVFQSRDSAGYDVAYVVAAGKANHAGEGGWKGLSGNSSVYGLEIEHTGVDPLGKDRQRIAARIHAAMFSGPSSMVCQHREWAPSRKIDAAEGVDANEFRRMVDEARGTKPPPSSGGGSQPGTKAPPFPYPSDHYLGKESPDPKCHSGYYAADATHVRTWQQRMKDRGWKIGVDGKYGSESDSVCRKFQAEKGLSVDGLVGPKTWDKSWSAPIT
ncbi:MAG: N-acetylmuramoyl-L-alanine amidase [Paenisporosarcina sp.]